MKNDLCPLILQETELNLNKNKSWINGIKNSMGACLQL